MKNRNFILTAAVILASLALCSCCRKATGGEDIISEALASAYARNVKPNTARYAAANDTLGAPKLARAIMFGDSITDGWPGNHPAFFADNGLVGRGISGQTSYQFLLRFGADVINLHPAVVVINYGTNDIAENSGPYVEEETFRNVKAMCKMAKDAGIQVILASTLPHKGMKWRPQLTGVMDKVVSLNALVKAYAGENGIPYVDYFSAMVSEDGSEMRPELSPDGVHPNHEGYLIMENLVLPVIDKLRYQE